MRFFTRVGENIAITEMQAWKFIADGDELATWGRNLVCSKERLQNLDLATWVEKWSLCINKLFIDVY